MSVDDKHMNVVALELIAVLLWSEYKEAAQDAILALRNNDKLLPLTLAIYANKVLSAYHHVCDDIRRNPPTMH